MSWKVDKVVKILLVVGLIVGIGVGSVGTLGAEPYAWVQFTRGDGEFETTPHLENWVTSYVEKAQENDYEVGVISYTWGSNFGALCGFDCDDNSGLNALDPSRLYVVADDEADGGDFTETASDEVINRTTFVDGGPRRTHIKAITLEDNSVMFGSANWTAGALSRQPNAIMVMNHEGVAEAFHNQIKNQWEGDNFSGEVDYQIHHEGPNEEEIEVYFIPDVYNNIPEGHAGGVLQREIDNAEESIMYHFNHITYSGLVDSITDATDGGVFAEGVMDDSFISDEDLMDQLREDHTSRIWDLDGSMHHKTMIFDMERIAFGSPNHTVSALARDPDNSNQEVLVVIDDFRLARRFMGEHRRMMALAPEDTDGPADSFEETPPEPVDNFEAENVEGEDNSLRLTWDAPADPGDFSRYYIFANTQEDLISSQEDLCDFEDSDGDGLICEDPVGDYSGFPAGPNLDSLHPYDDDADGDLNEDPWLFPEAQVKADVPADAEEHILDSIDYGSELPNNTDIWLAIVAADMHGNESEARFYGPVQSLPAEPGADPKFKLNWAEDESRAVGEESELKIDLHNDPENAEESIIRWTVDFQEEDNSFVPLVEQEAPEGWSAELTSDYEIEYSAAGSEYFIEPGDTVTFQPSVQNPPLPGESAELIGETRDNNDIVIPDISIGSLFVEEEELEISVVDHYASDGPNTIHQFGGSERLLEEDVTVTIELDTEPAEIPTLRYRRNDDPTGGAEDIVVESNQQAEWVYEATIAAEDVSDGDEVRFYWEFDGIEFDNAGQFYRYQVDGSVSDPTGLAVESASANAIDLSFEPIDDENFEQYEIFYSTESPVDEDDAVETITDRDPGEVSVTGLSEETTYYFNIRAVDDIGNVSPIDPDDEVSGTTTRDVTHLLDRAEDGVNTITTFDGSETVRQNDVTVYWNTDEELTTDDVALHYDFKSDSTASFTDLGGYTERTPLGSDTSFRAIIPESADGFDGENYAAFVLEIEDNIQHHPDGTPFLINIDEGMEDKVEGFEVSNVSAGEISLSWSSIPSTEDFETYRIYYSDTEGISRGAETWDKADDPRLGYMTTTSTTISDLEPGQSYYFRITTVNEKGSEGPLSEEIEGTTTTAGSVLLSEINFDSSTGYSPYIELTAVEGPVDIGDFKLDDLDGGSTGELSGDDLTLERDERAVVHLDGIEETEARYDLESGAMDSVYNEDEGVIVLRDGTGDSIDFLAYKPRAGDDDPTLAGWNGTAVVTYAQSGLDLDHPPVTGRLRDRRGEFKTTWSAEDWEVTTSPRPGRGNRFLEVESLVVSDSPSGVTHFRPEAVSSFRGDEAVKATEQRSVEVEFNQPPVQEDEVYFWYNQDENPGGLANPDQGDSFALEYDPATGLATGSGVVAEDTHGVDKRTMVTAHNVKAEPEAEDEIKLDREGTFYRYFLDNDPLPSIGGEGYAEVEAGKVLLYWTSYSDDLEAEFEEYRIFMDTGTVNRTSNSIGRAEADRLGDIGRGWLRVPVDSYNDTWNFRVGSVDHRGNITDITDEADLTGITDVGEFSDTVSVYVPRPIEIEKLTATDDTNTIDLRRQPVSGFLVDDTVTVEVEFDRETDTAILHYNTSPEDPADPTVSRAEDVEVEMIHQGGGVYTADIPAQEHDTTVTLGIQTDGEPKYRDGEAYRYSIQALAQPAVSDFKYYLRAPEGRSQSDLYVYWSPLEVEGSDSAAMFDEYQVLLDSDHEEPFQDDYVIQDSDDRSSLGDRETEWSVFRDMDHPETYVVAVRWQDEVKNKSALSDTHEVTVIQGQSAEDPVFDGTSWATELDGSEYLQGGEDYMVHFEFEESPPEPDNTYLEYNALPEKDKEPFEGEGIVDTIPLEYHEDLIWEGFLKQDDPGIDGAKHIAYQVHSGSSFYDNLGAYYRFNLDYDPVDMLEDFSLNDRDDVVYVSWSPVDREDFSTYRVRYRKTEQEEWTVVDKNDVEELGDMSREYLRLEVDPEANYYFNGTVVDRAEHRAYIPAELFLLRDLDAGDPEFREMGDWFFTMSDGDEQDLEVYLEDLGDSPWFDEDVTFNSPVEGLEFANGENSLDRTTGYEGTASAHLVVDGAEPGYHDVYAEWDNEYFTREISFTVRVLDEEETESEKTIVPFE